MFNIDRVMEVIQAYDKEKGELSTKENTKRTEEVKACINALAWDRPSSYYTFGEEIVIKARSPVMGTFHRIIETNYLTDEDKLLIEVLSSIDWIGNNLDDKDFWDFIVADRNASFIVRTYLSTWFTSGKFACILMELCDYEENNSGAFRRFLDSCDYFYKSRIKPRVNNKE